jgi:hypothetical protein
MLSMVMQENMGGRENQHNKMVNNKDKKLKGITGWLLIILFIFLVSALSSLILLFQKIKLFIIDSFSSLGVLITIIILIAYCVFIYYGIYLMANEKKKAVKISFIVLILAILFEVWYRILAVIIFYNGLDKINLLKFGLMYLMLNLFFIIAIFFYLRNSKRVKETLTK